MDKLFEANVSNSGLSMKIFAANFIQFFSPFVKFGLEWFRNQS